MSWVWAGALLVSAIWLLIMVYSVAFTSRPGTSVVRTRFFCPAMEREAEVEFRLKDGRRVDVTRCSLFGEFGDVTCGKLCVHLAAAA
jgi:hypothetical protein